MLFSIESIHLAVGQFIEQLCRQSTRMGLSGAAEGGFGVVGTSYKHCPKLSSFFVVFICLFTEHRAYRFSIEGDFVTCFYCT